MFAFFFHGVQLQENTHSFLSSSIRVTFPQWLYRSDTVALELCKSIILYYFMPYSAISSNLNVRVRTRVREINSYIMDYQ